MSSPRTVVFVCLHGSAKSVIASAYLNRLSAERGLNVHATAAGVEPDAVISPRVREGLRQEGLDNSLRLGALLFARCAVVATRRPRWNLV
jgi:arsenate reductase (thioredoxin)